MQSGPRWRLVASLIALFYRADPHRAQLALGCSALLGVAEYLEPYLFGRVVQLLAEPAAGNFDKSLILIVIAWMLLTILLIWCSRAMSIGLQDIAQEGSRSLWISYLSCLYRKRPVRYVQPIHSSRVLKAGIVGTNASSEIWQVFSQEQFQTLISLVIILPIAFFLNPALASILVFLVAIAYFVLRRNVRATTAAEELIESLEGNVAERASELILYRDLIRTSRATQREIGRFDQLLSSLRARYHAVARIWATATATVRGVFSFFMLMMLLAGVWLHQRGLATIGEIVTFVGILGYALAKVEVTIDSLRRVTSRLPAIHEFIQIAELDLSEVRPFGLQPWKSKTNLPAHNPPRQDSAYIEFDNVNFRYVDEQPVLNGVNFTVEKNSVIGISGSSGVGKTTLMYLMMRLLEPSEGEIRINGVNIAELDTEDWWHRIAIVFQDSVLLSATIEQNLRLTNEHASDAEIAAVLEEIGLHAKIAGLKNGYKTAVGEIGQKLSGGQRQLLNIARALIARPEILLLDEPTASLDSESERLVLKALVAARSQCTILVISHRSTTLNIADKIIHFNEDGCAACHI